MHVGNKAIHALARSGILAVIGLICCMPNRTGPLRDDSENPTEVEDDVGGAKTHTPAPLPDGPVEEPTDTDGDDNGENNPTSPTPPSPHIDPNRPSVGPTTRLLGRFDTTNPNAVTFAFSGSSMLTRIMGTGLDIVLSEQNQASYNGNSVNNFYDVFVDGEWHKTIAMQANVNLYAVADNLPYADHIIRVSKRTEPQLGTGVFGGFRERPGTTLLPAPWPKARKIEFIGDSITCGYGSDGNMAKATGCVFSDKTENVNVTYAAQLADALNAEFVAISYSGKGMIQNYDCVNDTINTMAKLYPSIIPLRNPNVYDANLWTPQAVVVNLGTNDYKMAGNCPAPDSNAFTNGWTSFLSSLRARYPNASIFCTVGPDLYAPYLAMAENNIQAAILQRTSAGDPNIFFVSIPVNNGQVGWGCGAHPNKAMHKLVADKMLPLIQAQMHW